MKPPTSFPITGQTVLQFMSGYVNPLRITQDFSPEYKELLTGRKEHPVMQAVHEIAEAWKANQVVILTGDPGSGKSTQYVDPDSCKTGYRH